MFKIFILLYYVLLFISNILAHPFLNKHELGYKKSLKTLRQVNLVLRHGHRGPQSSYENDPFKSDPMKPFGWGQLTKEGRLIQYNQGLFLRDRYGDFLGDEYSPKLFWLQSTDVDRAKMSALLEAAALWQPNEHQKFLESLNWQPVDLHFQPKGQDTLLLIWETCPDYARVYNAVLHSKELKHVNEKSEKLYVKLTNLTGIKIKNPEDVFDLYSTLEAEKVGMKFELPRWADDYYPEKLVNLSTLGLKLVFYNEILLKMKASPLITQITNNMVSKKDGTLKPKERKMFMYVGHDSTVGALLDGLNIWNKQIPVYSQMVMIELHEDKNDWNVQIYLRNSTVHDPYPLTIPGCEFACPLEKYLKLVQPMILSNEKWQELCELKDLNFVRSEVPLP